jgi:hypothetical protein
MTKLLKILFLLIASFCVCNWTNEKLLEALLDKVFFNTLSILIGLSIAIVGIFLGSVNSLYLSLYKMIKKDGTQFTDEEIDGIKTGLNSLIKELKDNSLLSIYGLVAIIILYIFKTMDIPFVKWFIESNIFTKNLTIHVTIIFISTLIFWSIIDSVKVVFNITKSFELIKDTAATNNQSS